MTWALFGKIAAGLLGLAALGIVALWFLAECMNPKGFGQ